MAASKKNASVVSNVTDKATAAGSTMLATAKRAANAPLTQEFAKSVVMGVGVTLGYAVVVKGMAALSN